MARSDVPYDVNDKLRTIVQKLVAVMLVFEFGDTGTHRSRDARDRQIKILLKQIYEELTGESLFYTDIPRFELWHEKHSIFDAPEGENENG